MNNLRKMFTQIGGFVLLSTLLGLTAQAVLPNGISLKTDLTVIETDSGSVAIPSISINPTGKGVESTAIGLSRAFDVFVEGGALFFDARELEAFEAGHIQGARHLTVEAFMDSLEYLDTLDPAQKIVTYCDGEDCNASIDLAAELNVMGFTQVFFFFGGWQEWSEADYPIQVSDHE